MLDKVNKATQVYCIAPSSAALSHTNKLTKLQKENTHSLNSLFHAHTHTTHMYKDTYIP